MSNADVHVTAADKTTWNSAPVSRGQTNNPNAITTTSLYYMVVGTAFNFCILWLCRLTKQKQLMASDAVPMLAKR